MKIDELNSLDSEGFVAALGWVFEDSPWVAERTWSARPFADVEALHRAMIGRLACAEPEEQLALLRAHPDLGTRARISSASTGEQAGAGLDHLTPQEFDRLQQLNSAYRNKFGFPFLFAVKGSTKHDILRALEQRLESSPEEEYEEALRQVSRIARFRLMETVQEGTR
ncbi:MAG: pucL 2 [Bryobacterales bacterium]|jgi:2-oxo-4-hydroxy-4-carboxy-5-ureidoimidazoline decarboxylase|nr:pucL 2 [Bryobacterales bacterium]